MKMKLKEFNQYDRFLGLNSSASLAILERPYGIYETAKLTDGLDEILKQNDYLWSGGRK